MSAYPPRLKRLCAGAYLIRSNGHTFRLWLRRKDRRWVLMDKATHRASEHGTASAGKRYANFISQQLEFDV